MPNNSIQMKFSVCHSTHCTAAVWFNYRHSSQFTAVLQPSVLHKEDVVERIQERSLSSYHYLLPPINSSPMYLRHALSSALLLTYKQIYYFFPTIWGKKSYIIQKKRRKFITFSLLFVRCYLFIYWVIYKDKIYVSQTIL